MTLFASLKGAREKSFLKKRSTLKEKNLLLRGANYFLLELTPFHKGCKAILTDLLSLKKHVSINF